MPFLEPDPNCTTCNVELTNFRIYFRGGWFCSMKCEGQWAAANPVTKNPKKPEEQ